jgi:Pyruvate/2-oxoacid:ferredoxin oxidoreductase delta subunit
MLRALKRFGSVFKSEKIIHTKYDPALCVHTRNGKVECTLCIETCPKGGITPAGDKVQFNTELCAGCGGCAKVCPTRAVRLIR